MSAGGKSCKGSAQELEVHFKKAVLNQATEVFSNQESEVSAVWFRAGGHEIACDQLSWLTHLCLKCLCTGGVHHEGLGWRGDWWQLRGHPSLRASLFYPSLLPVAMDSVMKANHTSLLWHLWVGRTENQFVRHWKEYNLLSYWWVSMCVHVFIYKCVHLYIHTYTQVCFYTNIQISKWDWCSSCSSPRNSHSTLIGGEGERCECINAAAHPSLLPCSQSHHSFLAIAHQTLPWADLTC